MCHLEQKGHLHMEPQCAAQRPAYPCDWTICCLLQHEQRFGAACSCRDRPVRFVDQVLPLQPVMSQTSHMCEGTSICVLLLLASK